MKVRGKENAEQMRERHEQELKTLQDNCKHPKLSGWMPYMWAPGHFGNDVKVCCFCGKVIKSKEGVMPKMFKAELE